MIDPPRFDWSMVQSEIRNRLFKTAKRPIIYDKPFEIGNRPIIYELAKKGQNPEKCNEGAN